MCNTHSRFQREIADARRQRQQVLRRLGGRYHPLALLRRWGFALARSAPAGDEAAVDFGARASHGASPAEGSRAMPQPCLRA